MSEGQSGYVFVCADEQAKNDGVELPTEEDGNLLLSVLQSQFESASGLKYRNPTTGGWRAVKLVDGTLCPPSKEGWGEATYVVVLSTTKPASDPNGSDADASLSHSSTGAPSVGYTSNSGSSGGGSDGYKRKLEDVEGERASKNPRSSSPDYYAQEKAQSSQTKSATSPPPPPPSSSGDSRQLNYQDLIVLGLEYGATDEDLKKYFQQYGEVTHAEVKKDAGGKSRGFGFVRFADAELQKQVHGMKHAINGRRIELKLPRQSPAYMPTKLFVGCLPLKPEVTTEELNVYFAQFGKVDDVYIPRPYRGFGFVSFNDPQVAQKILRETHSLRKSQLNITTADPKGSAGGRGGYRGAPYQPHYPPGGYDPYNQQPNYYGYGYAQPPQQAANTHYAYAGPPQSTSYGYAYQSAPPPPPPQAAQGDKQGQGYMQHRTYPPTAGQQRHDPTRQQPSGYHYSQPPAAYNSQAQVTGAQTYQHPQQRQGAERGAHYGYGGERTGFGGDQRVVTYQRDAHQPGQQQGQHYDPKSTWLNY